ncbi:MAG: hypothetical protein Tsb0021_01240 [Chlamydiales bacterium]
MYRLIGKPLMLLGLTTMMFVGGMIFADQPVGQQYPQNVDPASVRVYFGPGYGYGYGYGYGPRWRRHRYQPYGYYPNYYNRPYYYGRPNYYYRGYPRHGGGFYFRAN